MNGNEKGGERGRALGEGEGGGGGGEQVSNRLCSREKKKSSGQGNEERHRNGHIIFIHQLKPNFGVMGDDSGELEGIGLRTALTCDIQA